jgi:CMP-2-keto-3-deoxyoctulosonic acid synthetase
VPRTIASIEARMASTRLPGKVLADIAVADPKGFEAVAKNASVA